MTPKEAWEIIGGLSKTQKMPWYSWSISARKCITGAKLAKHEGTVCNKCYALKGRYMFPKVQNALYRRLHNYNNTNRLKWRNAFILLLKHKHKLSKNKVSYFRWYDSGDLQSVKMLRDINVIARDTPYIQHWLPTKEYKIMKDFILQGYEPCKNLHIKISMPNINQEVVETVYKNIIHDKVDKIYHPKISYTTVGAKNTEYECPASTQGNKCGDCRKCWSNMNVNYPLH